MLSTFGSSLFVELFYYLRKRTRSNWRFQISDHVMELLYLQAITWYERAPNGAACAAPPFRLTRLGRWQSAGSASPWPGSACRSRR